MTGITGAKLLPGIAVIIVTIYRSRRGSFITSTRTCREDVSREHFKRKRLGVPVRQFLGSLQHCSFGTAGASGVVTATSTLGRRSFFRGRITTSYFGIAGGGHLLEFRHQRRSLRTAGTSRSWGRRTSIFFGWLYRHIVSGVAGRHRPLRRLRRASFL